MVRDGRRTVLALAKAAGIDADASVIDTVTEATGFGAMKAKAADYTPVAGTGFWKSDEISSILPVQGNGKENFPGKNLSFTKSDSSIWSRKPGLATGLNTVMDRRRTSVL